MENKTKLLAIIDILKCNGCITDENLNYIYEIVDAVKYVLDIQQKIFLDIINPKPIDLVFIKAKLNDLYIDIDKINESKEKLNSKDSVYFEQILLLYEKYYYDVNTYLILKKL